MKKTNCVLIADTREKMVTRHQKELETISMEIKQITVGDYVLLTPAGNILAVIERKSLDDFSASLKDGRHSNKEKMIELRSQTGCRIVYIIEGPEFPDPNKVFGNIPYKYIESSIFHLMIRDNITTLRTRDSLGTAQALARFMTSMDSLCNLLTVDSMANTADPIDEICNQVPAELGDIITTLTAKHEKSDHDVVREMWSCFPGISVESASEYMRYWTITDIVRGVIPRGDITKFKLASGRAIGKKASDSLCGVTKLVEVRLLSTIPGISHTTATTLLNATPLSRLLSYGKEISIEIIGKNSRRLGDKLAEKVVKYFNYKTVCSDNNNI